VNVEVGIVDLAPTGQNSRPIGDVSLVLKESTMFCSACGEKAGGRFCSHCGAPLAAGAESRNWQQEFRYAELVRVPQVRAAIHYHASLARRGVTGEQFLGLCDKVVPLGVSMELVASLIQPLYASWGLGTGQQRSVQVAAPIGRVMLNVLCSLAARGQSLRRVEQGSDGCCFEAVIPSDIWSFAGDLLITVRQHAGNTEVEAAAKVKGQLYDWGKSQR
jgi:hypothetical protein